MNSEDFFTRKLTLDELRQLAAAPADACGRPSGNGEKCTETRRPHGFACPAHETALEHNIATYVRIGVRLGIESGVEWAEANPKV